MLCPSCFEEKGNRQICPEPGCGFDESVGTARKCLPFRHTLNGRRYVVGVVLGSRGGFGVAYKAFDTSKGTLVVVKEFLGKKTRQMRRAEDGYVVVAADYEQEFQRSLAHFRHEAKVIRDFNDRNIVRVIEVFDENGTGYYVMPFVEGWDLGQYLAEQGGRLAPQETLSIACDLLSGLAKLHDAKPTLLHCDIKPSNVLLTRKKKKAILIDFGAARRMTPRDGELPVFYSNSYAPPELARGEVARCGPWTDFYLLGATLYECLTGRPPPTWQQRSEPMSDPLLPVRTLRPDVDPKLARFIDESLRLEPKERPGDAASALRELRPPPPKKQIEPTGWPPTGSDLLKLWPAAALFVVMLLLTENFMPALGAALLLVACLLAVQFGKAKIRELRREANKFEVSLIGRNDMRTVLHTMRLNETLTIGREEADVLIDNPRLSSRHVSITILESGLFKLTDLNSTNHTYRQPPGTNAPPKDWRRVDPDAPVSDRQGRFMLGAYQDGGVVLEIRPVRPES